MGKPQSKLKSVDVKEENQTLHVSWETWEDYKTQLYSVAISRENEVVDAKKTMEKSCIFHQLAPAAKYNVVVAPIINAKGVLGQSIKKKYFSCPRPARIALNEYNGLELEIVRPEEEHIKHDVVVVDGAGNVIDEVYGTRKLNLYVPYIRLVPDVKYIAKVRAVSSYGQKSEERSITAIYGGQFETQCYLLTKGNDIVVLATIDSDNRNSELKRLRKEGYANADNIKTFLYLHPYGVYKTSIKCTSHHTPRFTPQHHVLRHGDILQRGFHEHKYIVEGDTNDCTLEFTLALPREENVEFSQHTRKIVFMWTGEHQEAAQVHPESDELHNQ